MNTKAKPAAEDSKETAVAVVTQGALAMPSFMSAEDMDSGFEGADKDSYAIPFLQILQKMSPMVDPDDPAYVEGARAGMLYNTVTQTLYDGKEGVLLVPCSYKRTFIQWGGREGDGGFKGEFTPEQIVEMQAKGEIVAVEGKLFKPNPDGSPINEKKNDYFADTRSHFVLIIEKDGSVGQAILSLASTQIKASRMLMTAMQQKKVDVGNGVKRTPPMFANVARLTTVGKSNDSGSWSGAVLTLEGMVTDPSIYADAKAFYAAVNDGAAKADYAKSGTEQTGNAAPSGGPEVAEQF